MIDEKIRLTMKKWHIDVPHGLCIGFAGENDAREIIIDTDAPDYFNYKLEVECNKKKNIVDMTREGSSLMVSLCAEMVSVSGFYSLQVRGTDGVKVVKSNVFNVKVNNSINATDEYGEFIPSEFIQLENRVTDACNKACDINNHPPIASEDGYWMLWDYEQQKYVKSEQKVPGAGSSDDVIRFDALMPEPEPDVDIDDFEDSSEDVIYFSGRKKAKEADDDAVIKF